MKWRTAVVVGSRYVTLTYMWCVVSGHAVIFDTRALHPSDMTYALYTFRPLTLIQSVTSFPRPDDPNGLFLVLQANGAAPCSRGTPVRCDSTIRLRHVATRNYLHSHREHASPLSQQQEVSAYVGGDDGDNWVVKCIGGGGGDHWMRDAEVELVHAVTGRYLHASKDYTFRNPIPGQLEVCASTRSSRNTKWATGEGYVMCERSERSKWQRGPVPVCALTC